MRSLRSTVFNDCVNYTLNEPQLVFAERIELNVDPLLCGFIGTHVWIKVFIHGDAEHRHHLVKGIYADAIRTALDNKQSKITASGILKGDGSGGVSKAVRGYDYAEPSHSDEVTLTAEGWSDGVQTITILYAGFLPITARTNGSVRISQDATDEQFAAWCAAQPRVTAQATNTITIKAAGTVPTIDIPVEVLIV